MLTKALLEKRTALTEEANAICELEATRDLTPEEEARFAEIAAELKKLDAKIDRAEEVGARMANLDKPARSAQSRGNDPGAGGQPASGPQPKTEFESLGEFVAAVGVAGRGGRIDPRLVPNAATDMNMDGDASRGSYALPPQFIDELRMVDPQGGIVRESGATVIPSGSIPDAEVTMPALDQSDQGESPALPKTYGGVALSWIEEGGEKPQTDFKLRQLSLKPYEIAGSLDITDKLLRNWRAAGALIAKLFSGAKKSAEDYAFLRGSGTGQPTGIIGHASTLKVARVQSNKVKYLDLVNMLSDFLVRGGTPVWVASRTLMPQLLTMEDTEGHLIFQPNAREGMPSQLLGNTLKWNERSPALGSEGDLLLADFSQYLIKDGSGPFLEASPHVRFRENITVFKFFWNVDGKPWLTQPFRGEDNEEYSPFVVLDNVQAS